MSGASSNAAQVSARLKSFVESVDFTRPGRDGSLGRDALAEVTQGILADTIGDQKSPDGAPLEANRGKYGDTKRDRGLPVGIGLRGKKALAAGGKANDAGRMLSEVEVRGQQEIGPDSAIMRYGATDQARKKAEWFTGGATGANGCEPSGAAGQPPRPFYGLSTATVDRVMVEVRDYVRASIRKFNRF